MLALGCFLCVANGMVARVAHKPCPMIFIDMIANGHFIQIIKNFWKIFRIKHGNIFTLVILIEELVKKLKLFSSNIYFHIFFHFIHFLPFLHINKIGPILLAVFLCLCLILKLWIRLFIFIVRPCYFKYFTQNWLWFCLLRIWVLKFIRCILWNYLISDNTCLI